VKSWSSLIALAVVLASIAGAVLYAAGGGEFGTAVVAGEPTDHALPTTVIAERDARQAGTAADLDVVEPKQILFGDLHVHSSFSTDAFQLTLPTAGGEGIHPVADACDFARFCANLDFWSNAGRKPSTPSASATRSARGARAQPATPISCPSWAGNGRRWALRPTTTSATRT